MKKSGKKNLSIINKPPNSFESVGHLKFLPYKFGFKIVSFNIQGSWFDASASSYIYYSYRIRSCFLTIGAF